MSNDATTDACCASRTSVPLVTKFHAPFEAVQIMAADYNPRSVVRWDGSPFSSYPDWLRNALDSGALVPVTPNGTDYAEWQLTTDEGTLLGTPGDWIIRDQFGHIRILADREAMPHTHAERVTLLNRKLQHLQQDLRHNERLAWHEQRGEPEAGMTWCPTCDGKRVVNGGHDCGPCDGTGEVRAD